MNGPRAVRNVGRVIRPALVTAAIGLLGFGLALLVDHERAMFSYLAAFAYGVSIALGALFLVMIAHATNARWFVAIRRLAETAAATMPVFAFLVLPILIGLATLYPWVPPLQDMPAPDIEIIQRKQAYLNVPFFVLRTALYFAVWTGLALALRRWSLRQDRSPDDAPASRALAISGPGLAAAGLTASFAAVDWLMSLHPTWVSTVFGVYWFAGGMYGGIAALTLLAWAARRAGILRDEVAEGHDYALGRLMLAFTIFWAYIAFSQGFLVYIADLPHEVGWYLDRLQGGWGLVLLLLVVGHFLVPFAALLSYRLKHRAGPLAAVAAWMLGMHYVDTFWLVNPALRGREFSAHWADLAALALVLGAAVAYGAWRLAGVAAVPWRDPRIEASMGYRRE